MDNRQELAEVAVEAFEQRRAKEPNVKIRVHKADCEHCAKMRDSAQLLEPVKGFGSQDTTPTIPEELHSISRELVRAYELATGKPLDVEVRLYYRGQEFVYTMPEERARELFLFNIGPGWSIS